MNKMLNINCKFVCQDVESQYNYNNNHSHLPESLQKTKRKRVICKKGGINVKLYGVPRKKKLLVMDIFTSSVEMRWRYTFLAFAASFFVSWLLFAGLWYLICYVHGDLEQEDSEDVVLIHHREHDWSNSPPDGFVPCVYAVKSFSAAFLFSVETQHTIGFGHRGTTDACVSAIVLECVQSIVGVLIQACMAGIVFAKLAKPKRRSKTLQFSKNAVVSQRNGVLYLQFRIGDMRCSHLLETHVRAQLLHKVTTAEGESIPYHQEELQVGTTMEGRVDRALILWPVIFSHRIDESSPLYTCKPEDLLSNKFEIIVLIEGIIEPTGTPVQARTSYLPNEILWGRHFENLVTYLKHKGLYAIDCSSINQTTLDNTPWLSAKEMDELKNLTQSTSSTVSSRPIHTSPAVSSQSSIINVITEEKLEQNFSHHSCRHEFERVTASLNKQQQHGCTAASPPHISRNQDLSAGNSPTVCPPNCDEESGQSVPIGRTESPVNCCTTSSINTAAAAALTITRETPKGIEKKLAGSVNSLSSLCSVAAVHKQKTTSLGLTRTTQFRGRPSLLSDVDTIFPMKLRRISSGGSIPHQSFK